MTKREKQKIVRANRRKVYLAAWETEKARGMSLSAFCRAHGLARKNFYLWLNHNGSVKSTSPIHRADSALKAKAIELYLRYKGTWSSETISMALGGKLSAPTIRRLITPLRRIMPAPVRLSVAEFPVFKAAKEPNAVWSVDWTEYKLHGKKFFILLFMDEASRLYLGWYIFAAAPTAEDVSRCLKDIFARYQSRPSAMKFDGAKVFSSASWRDLLMENGIGLRRIRPRCPQDQGVIERGMREVKTWLRANAPKNPRELDNCLDEGMFMLNFLKPKMVLNAATPAAVYFRHTAKYGAQISEDLCPVK